MDALFSQLNQICPENQKIMTCNTYFEDIKREMLPEISKLELDRRYGLSRSNELPGSRTVLPESVAHRTQNWLQQTHNINLSLDEIGGFYGGEEFKFTNCEKSGMFGPDIKRCREIYNVDWVKHDNHFSIWQKGIQRVIIPVSAKYEITAYGAGWVNCGAKSTGNIKLYKGTEMFIAVGQRGTDESDGCGGTFLAVSKNKKLLPMIIAGGAGGGQLSDYGNGSLDKCGNRSDATKRRNIKFSPSGAPFFPAGNTAWNDYYNGGSGFSGIIEGQWEGTKEFPQPFSEGMTGGKRAEGFHDSPDCRSDGGFGGGGHGLSGGGGGYTGGNGGFNGGGGGGSLTTDKGKIEIGHKKPGYLKIKIIKFCK